MTGAMLDEVLTRLDGVVLPPVAPRARGALGDLTEQLCGPLAVRLCVESLRADRPFGLPTSLRQRCWGLGRRARLEPQRVGEREVSMSSARIQGAAIAHPAVVGLQLAHGTGAAGGTAPFRLELFDGAAAFREALGHVLAPAIDRGLLELAERLEDGGGAAADGATGAAERAPVEVAGSDSVVVVFPHHFAREEVGHLAHAIAISRAAAPDGRGVRAVAVAGSWLQGSMFRDALEGELARLEAGTLVVKEALQGAVADLSAGTEDDLLLVVTHRDEAKAFADDAVAVAREVAPRAAGLAVWHQPVLAEERTLIEEVELAADRHGFPLIGLNAVPTWLSALGLGPLAMLEPGAAGAELLASGKRFVVEGALSPMLRFPLSRAVIGPDDAAPRLGQKLSRAMRSRGIGASLAVAASLFSPPWNGSRHLVRPRSTTAAL